MLVVFVMIAAVIIPLILFFFAPNAPPAQPPINNNENGAGATIPTANQGAGAPTSATTSPEKLQRTKRRSELPAAEIIALQTRLHITKPDATITISLHKQFTTTSEATGGDYEDLERVLTLLSDIGDVFVIVHCDNDEDEQEEARIRHILGEKAAYFQDFAHRILFCASSVGKIAFLRQLKPLFHIEFDPKIYEDIRPHIPIIVLHRLSSSTADSALHSMYQQFHRPYPNIIQQRISNLLTLTVKS